MFKKNDKASSLFMVALTLGLVAITFWNFAAGQAFGDLDIHAQLSEVLETTIYLAICSVLAIVVGTLLVKRLRKRKARNHQAFSSLFLILCVLVAAFVVYHTSDFHAPNDTFNTFYGDAYRNFEIVTNPAFWLRYPATALFSLNGLWADALFFCLLFTNIFFLPFLWREARKNGRKHWSNLALCLGFPLAFIVDNVESLYNLQKFYLPTHGYDLIYLFYDAAPFLGLSALVLAMLTREQGKPLSRKIWWIGLVITSILSLDLVAMAFEIRDILANVMQIDVNIYFIPMHFWPATPVATMSILSIAILSMIVALIMERRSRKIIAPSMQTNPQVDPSVTDEEIEDLESFEVEITDL